MRETAATSSTSGRRHSGADGRPRWRDASSGARRLRDRSLRRQSQAGLVNNLNDGMAWGLLPLFYAAAGLASRRDRPPGRDVPGDLGRRADRHRRAVSDLIGRKPLIVGGMLVQAVAIAAIALDRVSRAVARRRGVLGLGTAMVYPTLLAASPMWPIRPGGEPSIGVYRLWRDLGFAVGAILVGVLADRFDPRVAILVVAGLTAGSGLVVALRMRETRPPRPASGGEVERPPMASA